MSTAVQDIGIQDADQASIKRVFDAQKKRAVELRTSTAAERIDKIKRLRALLLERSDEVKEAAYADFGKPGPEVDATEILPIVQEANHAIRSVKRWMKPERKRPTFMMFGTSAEVRNEPRGVCLIISPWNYPVNLTFGPLVSALAAGNTAIIKPSEMTPHCAALMEKFVGELFDERDVAIFQGEVETSQQLLALPFDHIFFTGSPAVGRIVMKAASEHLTSVTLELGGKSPVVVDKSANIKQAAHNLTWAKFANNGQTCIAPDYVYVHADVADQFQQATRESLEKLYGDQKNMAANPDYCRIVNGKHFDRVKGMLDDATQRGAKTLMGGTTSNDDNYFSPTVMTDVTAESRIMEEEIFGPIMPILTFSNIEQPIEVINSKPKPLALYVFAKDDDVVEQVIGRTSAGGTCINHSMVQFLHGELPFGGVNNSGIGNSHGHYGFKAFSHERAVLRERFSLSFLFLPPYGRFTRWFIRFATKHLS